MIFFYDPSLRDKIAFKRARGRFISYYNENRPLLLLIKMFELMAKTDIYSNMDQMKILRLKINNPIPSHKFQMGAQSWLHALLY